MTGNRTSVADATGYARWSPGAGMLALVVIFSGLCLHNPVYTWDIVGYVGSVAALTLEGPEAIHAETYAVLESQLPASAWQQLVSTGYGEAMAASAADFHTQLGMYQIKPLYVGLLDALDTLGLGVVDAGFLVSLASALGLMVVAWRWLQRYVPAGYALMLVALLAFSSRLFDVARAMLPDALSAFVVFSGVYLVLEKPRLRLAGCLLLAFSVLVRTNNVLFVAPLLLYVGLSGDRPREVHRVPLLAAGASVAAYLLVSYRFGHDWWRLFHHTFLGSIVNHETFSGSFEWGAYREVLAQRLQMLVVGDFVIYTMLVPFLLLALLGFLHSRQQAGDVVVLRATVVLCLVNVVLYFFLFPLVETWDRFFVPFYFLTAVFVVRSASLPLTSGIAAGQNCHDPARAGAYRPVPGCPPRG